MNSEALSRDPRKRGAVVPRRYCPLKDLHEAGLLIDKRLWGENQDFNTVA